MRTKTASEYWATAEAFGPDFNGSPCMALPHRANTGGYIQIRQHCAQPLAHRFFYEHFIGPIPEDLTLDHLCRNRWCVNPWHLEPVTRGENTLRGDTITGNHMRKTHCKRGHPLSGDNLRYSETRGRECITCIRAYQRDRYRKAKANARQS